ASSVTALADPVVEPAERGREHRGPLLEHDLDGCVDKIGRPGRPARRRRNPKTLADAIRHLLASPQRRLWYPDGIDWGPEIAMQPEIHAERTIGQLADAPDHPSQIVWRHVKPRQDAEAAGAAHLGDQLRPRDGAHARLDDGILDTQKITKRGAEAHGSTPDDRARARSDRRRARPRLVSARREFAGSRRRGDPASPARRAAPPRHRRRSGSDLASSR